jgi:uncharacterized protein
LSRVITIVGSSARAAAFSAVRAGFSIRAADLFADVDLRRASTATAVTDYPAGLEAVLIGSQPGGWIYTGGLENSPSLIDRWSRLRPLWGNSGEALRRVRRPELLAAAMQQAGMNAPRVEFDSRQVRRNGSWLIKGLRSSGGVHVSVWNELTPDPSPESDHYFQELISGTPCSAVYVAARGTAAMLGATRQLIGERWTGASGLRYCGSVGPLELSESIRQQFARIGSELAEKFNLVGLFGVDAIVNDLGVWPVEVNPRYTASIEVLERSSGFHAIDLHVTACRDGTLPAHRYWPRSVVSAKAILFAASTLEVAEATSELIEQESGAAWPAVADIPAPGTIIEAGWPILTVLASGDTERATLERLEERAAIVRQQIAARS